jgi:hypothetical protein
MHGSYWLIFTFQRATAIITPNRHFNFFFLFIFVVVLFERAEKSSL